MKVYIHPITILSTLPAGCWCALALMICRQDFSVIALIGVVLLIGIVRRNAIMMIDFALDADANRAWRRWMPFTSVPAAFPPHHDDYHAALLARSLWRWEQYWLGVAASAGITIIGGLIFSQC